MFGEGDTLGSLGVPLPTAFVTLSCSGSMRITATVTTRLIKKPNKNKTQHEINNKRSNNMYSKGNNNNNNNNDNNRAFISKKRYFNKIMMKKIEVMGKKVERGLGPRATVGATFVTL